MNNIEIIEMLEDIKKRLNKLDDKEKNSVDFKLAMDDINQSLETLKE